MFVLTEGSYTGDVVRKLEQNGSIISATHYSKAESCGDWHCHENLHISYVFQGAGSESQSRVAYHGIDGLFTYHSGERHRWVSKASVSKSANIEIGSEFYAKYDCSEALIVRGVQESMDIVFLILKMQQELWWADSHSGEAIQALLLELVGRRHTLYTKDAPGWVSKLTQLLHDRWNEALSLQELSLLVGVHPVTISKFFRKYFACTLGEYLRKLKIEKSIALIKGSQKSLTEVAFECGFADQSHFCRTFKHFTGFLPKQFRRL